MYYALARYFFVVSEKLYCICSCVVGKNVLLKFMMWISGNIPAF